MSHAYNLPRKQKVNPSKRNLSDDRIKEPYSFVHEHHQYCKFLFTIEDVVQTNYLRQNFSIFKFILIY